MSEQQQAWRFVATAEPSGRCVADFVVHADSMDGALAAGEIIVRKRIGSSVRISCTAGRVEQQQLQRIDGDLQHDHQAPAEPPPVETQEQSPQGGQQGEQPKDKTPTPGCRFKHDDGDASKWNVVGPADVVKPGAEIRVLRRDGKAPRIIVGEIVRYHGDTVEAKVERTKGEPRGAGFKRGDADPRRNRSGGRPRNRSKSEGRFDRIPEDSQGQGGQHPEPQPMGGKGKGKGGQQQGGQQEQDAPPPPQGNHSCDRGLITQIATDVSRREIAQAVQDIEVPIDPIVQKVLERAQLPRTVVVRDPQGVERKIDGYVHPVFDRVVQLIKARRNVMLVGPAGCGKSHLARAIATALNFTRFGSVSCTAGMSEGQLLGRLLPTGEGGAFEYHAAEFVSCYEHGGLFLLDELDAADSNVLLVLNQGLANGHLPVPNRITNPQAARHSDFSCIAACNTFGHGANRLYVGRNQLDEATLDRFRIGTVEMDYDRTLEKALVGAGALLERVWKIRDKVNALQLRRVVSTRFLLDAHTMVAHGWTVDDCVKQLVCGWSKDDQQKVGVTV